MIDFSSAYPDRKYIVLYYIDEMKLSVDKVQCYGNNSEAGIQEMYWVPEKGLSVTLGYQLFLTKSEAIKKLMKHLGKELTALESRIVEIKKFRKEHKDETV